MRILEFSFNVMVLNDIGLHGVPVILVIRVVNQNDFVFHLRKVENLIIKNYILIDKVCDFEDTIQRFQKRVHILYLQLIIQYINLFNKKQIKMDQQNQPIQGLKLQPGQPGIPSMSGMPTGSFQMPGFPQPRPMQMGQMGMRPGMQVMHKPMMSASIGPIFDQDQKAREFAKGVYVSGFEKTVTVAMIQNHFSKVKNIHAIKLPITKLNQNKGFAFIYFGSQDDADQVKLKLDRTAILKKKIRITKTVVKEKVSKMIFKLKFKDLQSKQVELIEKSYFNQQNLEKQVSKLLKQIFNNSIQLNKIFIPRSKNSIHQLKYARVFFYIRNFKEALAITKRMDQNTIQRSDRNDYEVILTYIMKALSKNQTFSKFCEAELYQFTKKNQTNILHIKGIKYAGQDKRALTQEFKQFIQQKNPQWNIKNCFVGIVPKGAWSNITFETAEEAKQAFQAIKNQRAKFRDVRIYANLRNMRDNRTVVISAVNKDVTEKDVHKFLTEVATGSGAIEMNNPDKGRKYDFFSFNIIQEKIFYKTNKDETVIKTQDKQISESWRFVNRLPRRIIIHFQNEISSQQFSILTNHFRTTSGFKEIFVDNKLLQFRVNHQKGHTEKSKATVSFQVIKPNITEQDIDKFLAQVAATSAPIDETNLEKGRRYDVSQFSLNLNQSTAHRKILVSFVNYIPQELAGLQNHFKNTAGFKDIFIDDDNKYPFIAQKTQKNIYVAHHPSDNPKPKRVHNMQRPLRNSTQRPHQQNNQYQNQNQYNKPTQPKIDFTSLKMDVGGIPKSVIPNQGRIGGNVPLAGISQKFQHIGGINPSMRPMPQQMGQIPMGTGPNRQQIPGPGINNRPPLMGQPLPMGGLPPMGSYPPMGGIVRSTTQQKDQKKDK